MQTQFLIAIAKNPEITNSVFDWTTLLPSIKWQEIDTIKTTRQDDQLVLNKSLTSLIKNKRVRDRIYEVIEYWDYNKNQVALNSHTGIYQVSQI